MINKTFEDISKHSVGPELKDETKVNVRVAKGLGEGYNYFKGKIVGVGNNTINKSYLVECTDGFLPNETYKFKVINIPYSEIEEI